jgi:hypothetical protein
MLSVLHVCGGASRVTAQFVDRWYAARSTMRGSRFGMLGVFTALCVLRLGGWLPEVSAATLNAGDIVIATSYDGFDLGLQRVDPINGALSVISDSTHGAGPALNVAGQQTSVARVASGHLVVSTPSGVISVDPATGDRSLLSPLAVKSLVANGNDIYALTNTSLIKIDAETGDATPLAQVFGSTMTIDHGEMFVVSGPVQQFSLTGALLGTLPINTSHVHNGIAVTGDSLILAGDGGFAVYDRSGNWTGLINDYAGFAINVAFDANGKLLLNEADLGWSNLLRQTDDNLSVFRATATTLVSGNVPPDRFFTYAMTVVPEPSTVVLCATAFVGVALTRVRMMRQTRRR